MSASHLNPQSLPAWTYTSEPFFELEREHLLLTSWQLVCHISNVPEPGDYFTFDFLGRSVFVLRGKDGEVRAFHNHCRHRGARLLDDAQGNCGGRISCPYHAWTYGLAGELLGVPKADTFESFVKEEHGLKPIRMEIFLGFVFVRFDGDGPSVAEQFAPYLDDLLPYKFEDLQPSGRVTLRRRSVNWKTIADNYVDALHIPVAHPGLTSLLGNSYAIETRGTVDKMSGTVGEGERGTFSNRGYRKFLPDVAHLPEEKKRLWLYYRLWPNLAFDIYPDQVDFMQFIPLSATETLIREIPYALPDARREMRAARYLNWRINRQVNAEDTDLVDRVQAGMASGAFSSGPFSNEETLLIASAERMRKILPASRSDAEPYTGGLNDYLML